MRQIALWERVFDARLSSYCLHPRRQTDVWGNWSISPEYSLDHHTTDAQLIGPEKEAEILDWNAVSRKYKMFFRRGARASSNWRGILQGTMPWKKRYLWKKRYWSGPDSAFGKISFPDWSATQMGLMLFWDVIPVSLSGWAGEPEQVNQRCFTLCDISLLLAILWLKENWCMAPCSQPWSKLRWRFRTH